MIPSFLASIALAVSLSIPFQGHWNGPQIETYPITECGRIWEEIVDAGQRWYFSNPQGFFEHCPDLIRYFHTTEDKKHILLVAQCESGFLTFANDDRWGHLRGGRPEGLLSFMTHIDHPARLRPTLAPYLDMLNTHDAGYMASVLVYETGLGSAYGRNWWHWWSCGHVYGGVATALGIWAPEQWYCPEPNYWDGVPPGSGEAALRDC